MGTCKRGNSHLINLLELHPCVRGSTVTVVEDGRQFVPGLGLPPSLLLWLARPGWRSCNRSQWPQSGSRAGRVKKIEDIELVDELVKDVDERSLPVRSPA